MRLSLRPRRELCEHCSKTLNLETNWYETNAHVFCDIKHAILWSKKNYKTNPTEVLGTIKEILEVLNY